jgi:UDP-N-acetylglucosamine transferase subunit ALG13
VELTAAQEATRVFVTVGSTRFDALVGAVASPLVLRTLFDLGPLCAFYPKQTQLVPLFVLLTPSVCAGVRVLVVQYGQSHSSPPFEQSAREAGVPVRVVPACDGFMATDTLLVPEMLTCVSFDRRPAIQDEITAASLLIAHAGTGTVLEALTSGVPAVVVPNRALMHDHQSEFAAAVTALLPAVLRLSAPEPHAVAAAVCGLAPLRRHSVQAPDLRQFAADVTRLCGIAQ